MCEHCQHEHNEEHCDCCYCCDEEKELVRDRRELSDEEIESIIVEKYNTKDEKTKVFIRKALKKQGDWYDYSKVIYKNSRSVVIIHCPVHGDFEQAPRNHLVGSGGCKSCYMDNSRSTTEEFIEKAKKVHKDKYDYSEVEYVNNHTKVKIFCHKCGEYFYQTPANHLSGGGCINCSGNKKYTREEFIEKANLIHNNKYDYSKVEYTNIKNKVIIHCNKHGDFEQIAEKHLDGCGCPSCANEDLSIRYTKTTEQFIEEARKVHGDKYNYDKVNYVDSKTKVIIHCPEHGDFEQAPSNHLQKQGCPQCGNQRTALLLSSNTEEFIEKASVVHNNEYDYSKTKYINSKTKVIITCLKHGDFEQTPDNHLLGNGCPECKSSIGETYIKKYLEDHKYSFIRRKLVEISEVKSIIPDFIIENTWIEYNGEQHYKYIDYFHNYKRCRNFNDQLERDIEERIYCLNNGIRLIEIPYTFGTYKEVSDFLDKALLQNIDPNTLIDYSKLYKLDNTGFKIEDLFPT